MNIDNGLYIMKNGLNIDEYGNGTKAWWLNGKRHRIDGPAVEWSDGAKAWYVNGNRHRIDGPAIELANGANYWFLNGAEFKHPKSFDTMESWFLHLNCNEEQTYQVIHDIKGIIEIIKNPSGKQIRVHQMRWVL